MTKQRKKLLLVSSLSKKTHIARTQIYDFAVLHLVVREKPLKPT